MNKISTIFKRDEQTKRVTPILDSWAEGFNFSEAIATEKIDGTNVRLTVRNHILVRLEKRRNPTKIEKYKGIVEPWYVDAYETEANDKYMWESAKNTDLSFLEDGEWSAEAVGPKIQGNPLNLTAHRVFFFTHPDVEKQLQFENVPTTYEELKIWMPQQKSHVGINSGIEGIVWHHPNGRMVTRED